MTTETNVIKAVAEMECPGCELGTHEHLMWPQLSRERPCSCGLDAWADKHGYDHEPDCDLGRVADCSTDKLLAILNDLGYEELELQRADGVRYYVSNYESYQAHLPVPHISAEGTSYEEALAAALLATI